MYKDNARYARQIMLPEIDESGQDKLGQSRVLVIGAGGLGCSVLQHLTAVGVGKIVVMDDDMVSESNLHRQVLYRTDDIGKPKVNIAHTRLYQLNPLVNIVPMYERFTSDSARELLQEVDLVVDACDNVTTRHVINDACDAENKTWIYGSVSGFLGQISVCNFPQDNGHHSGTYRCLFPNLPEEERSNGIIGVTPALIGTLQATQIIKIICGLDGILYNQILNYDLLTMQQRILTYRRTR